MPKSLLDAAKCLLGACVILAIVAIGSPALALSCPTSSCMTSTGSGDFQGGWSPSETYTDGSTVGGSPAAPYFNHINTFEASQDNIGYYITNSGAYPGALGTHTLGTPPTAGQAGPGSALKYWGNSNGTADPGFFFNNGTALITGTFKFGWSNFTGNNPVGNPNGESFNKFGWFETNASGSAIIGSLHQVIVADASIKPGDTFSFTPTLNYGLYLQNDRGIFTTLASLGTDTSGPASPTGNTITPAPADCGRTSPTDPPCPSVLLQHFSVFQDSATKWFGIEDLHNFGPGIKCPDTTNFPTSCIDRSNIDQDYNDFIFTLTGGLNPPEGNPVPEPSSMMLLGSGLLVVSIGIALRRRVFKR